MNQEQSGEIPCLDSEQIRALVLGEIPPGRILQFEKHLASCGLCRERLEKESGDPSWMEKVRVSLIQPIGANEENNASPTSTTPPDPVLSLLDSSTHPDALGKIKDYEILGVLGRGGMGTVLRAFDPGLNRFVALKILSPHLAANATARKRFLREARAAAAIAHENVIAIHGVSEFKGIPYLVMPLIRGDSLQKRMRENGPLETEEVLRIGLQTASGLAAAHSQGLIHRDVKPANILLGPGTERVTLTDFGLARTVDEVDLTQTGMLAGTPRYMSPEQTRGENLDTRSDLFSLGTVLFEMVTGHAPFRGQTTFTLMKSITESDHKPVRDLRPDCPEWLERIIHRLLAKNPIDRFASAKDVQRLLSQGLAHLRSPKTEMAPATAGFVLPTKDTIGSAEPSPASPAFSNPQSNRITSILLSLTPFHWGVGVLLMLVIASIPITMLLEASPRERLAIIAVLLSPINLGIIVYGAYRIYRAMFGKSRTKDTPVEVAPAHSPNSKSHFANKLSPAVPLSAFYPLAGFFILSLTSFFLTFTFLNNPSTIQPLIILLLVFTTLSVCSILYIWYFSKSNNPLWKRILPALLILFIIATPFLAEWAHQSDIAQRASLTSQPNPRDKHPLQTYDIANDAIPSPEPLIRGGGLVAPLFPGIPGDAPNNSSLPPIPHFVELNPSPIFTYRPAKPFSIKSLGLLPDPENASYYGYEITVPPEQLIAISIYEETPEAKRVRMMGPGGRSDSPAIGLIYNPTKEPKRAIWSMSGRKSSGVQNDKFVWRLNWADQTESNVRGWRNSDELRESFLGNLDFHFPPKIVSYSSSNGPLEVSTEIHLEMASRDARPGTLKSLGGIARGYIQFHSVPMPTETLQIKPSIRNALREFPGTMAPTSGNQLPGDISELALKPIVGMGPKYWEWFHGFTPSGTNPRIQLTVYSRNNIKVLGTAGDLDQAVKVMSTSGFLTDSNIILKHDPLLVNKTQMNELAQNLLAKGYKTVKVEELPKSRDGLGEIVLSYPPGRGEDFLKILEPKIPVWNKQQKETSPKDPDGTIGTLGKTDLFEAKGTYRFLKMLITVFDKAKESRPGEPISDLTPPVPELPNALSNPPSAQSVLFVTEKGSQSKSKNPKVAPAGDPSPQTPAPKDSPSNPPLKKDAPKGDSPKKDLPAKETLPNRDALKQ